MTLESIESSMSQLKATIVKDIAFADDMRKKGICFSRVAGLEGRYKRNLNLYIGLLEKQFEFLAKEKDARI